MSKKLMHKVLLVFLCSCAGIKNIQKFEPKKNLGISPGELKMIEVSSGATHIECGNEMMQVSRKGSKSYFVFAESYFSQRETVVCKIMKNKNELYAQEITVKRKEYPFETLSVNPKRVKLNKKDLDRVIRERKILKNIYKNSAKNLLIKKNFSIPLKSKVTSFYGTRRLFNNVRKSQHLGIDYRAKVGVPIPSSNGGKVVLARNLFYTGNTVIIDHGLGIFTLYGHLNKIDVEKGQFVKKFQILGKAGKTGRVTGPHLHWGVKVNGHWVDGDILTALNLL
tara:strand:- start:122 stop:961 length:840 start_codon:yes stop_codon:yes gene_type:complete